MIIVVMLFTGIIFLAMHIRDNKEKPQRPQKLRPWYPRITKI